MSPAVVAVTNESVSLAWSPPSSNNGAHLLSTLLWACDVQSAMCFSSAAEPTATSAPSAKLGHAVLGGFTAGGGRFPQKNSIYKNILSIHTDNDS